VSVDEGIDFGEIDRFSLSHELRLRGRIQFVPETKDLSLIGLFKSFDNR
jgi:hypothetical protein